jgi:hypothetical protein
MRHAGLAPFVGATLALSLTHAVVPSVHGQGPPRESADAPDLTADARACRALQGRRVATAEIVAATFAYPPFNAHWMNSTRTAVTRVPFCRLEGISRPSPRSHVELEVWLPARSAWNGRFLGVGAGGPLGDINRPALAGAVTRGYAAVATDNGHRSAAPRDGMHWALGEWERIVDYGYRGHEVATAAGKAAVHAYYGSAPKFSYYAGCSQGGQKALFAAQRRPADYDGILAGAPGFSWPDLMTQQAWSVRAFTETPRSSLTAPQMRALNDAVLARCGGPNGLVGDPRECRFDPGELQCPRAAGASCLSPEQVTAVRKVYDGPRTSNGTSIVAGYTRGSERGWEQFYARVAADGSEGGGSWLGVYRHMVFDDPYWTLPQLDFDRDPALAKRKLGPVLDADSPDLDAFERRGGKLILYQGWADQQVSAEEALRYHARVVARAGREVTDRFFRLFMVPGMWHCFPELVAASGPAARGPNLVPHAEYDPSVAPTPENDALEALQAWVEKGRPPERFIVRIRHDDAGLAARTVLACAEPANAKYRGTGDPMDASNWACIE